MTRTIYAAIVGAAVASQLGATDCGGGVLRDPGFDLWCGDALCAWKIERGDIQRVPTWHDADAGVELVGDDTAIEQVSPVNSSDSSCITFDLVANISDDAEVYLNVDIQGDGTAEMHERLPASSWRPLSYSIAIKPPYDGIRFEITKRGGGTAVLAQIGAHTSDTCGGLTPLDGGPHADGGSCIDNTGCTSGKCVVGIGPPASVFGLLCVGCDPGTPAGPDVCGGPSQLCGVGAASSPLYAVPTECVAAAAKQLGERCLWPGECASGTCFQNRCSTCNLATCPGGAVCGFAWGPTFFDPSTNSDVFVEPGPSVCGAGSHANPMGAPCGTDADCASQHCAGTPRTECEDGRPCASAADCPSNGGLDSGACLEVGVQGGSCD